MSCDQLPPPAAPCLIRRSSSTHKGGTLIAEDVTDQETHRRRLCDPDGYRPAHCRRCGHSGLHVHDYPERQVRSGNGRSVIRVVRHRCAGCGAIWRILPAFLARFLRCVWSLIEQAVKAVIPPTVPRPSAASASLPASPASPPSPPSPPAPASPSLPAPSPSAALAPSPAPSPPPPAPSPSAALAPSPASSPPVPASPPPPASSPSAALAPFPAPFVPAPPAPVGAPRLPRAPGLPPRTPLPASTVRRWRARMAMSAALLCQVLATSGAPDLERLVHEVGVSARRADLVAAYVAHQAPPPGQALAHLSALLHRLVPGVRLM